MTAWMARRVVARSALDYNRAWVGGGMGELSGPFQGEVEGSISEVEEGSLGSAAVELSISRGGG